MTLRLLPSDPLYPALDFLLTTRAQWINAACHYDLQQYPQAERSAFVAWMDAELERVFEELAR